MFLVDVFNAGYPSTRINIFIITMVYYTTQPKNRGFSQKKGGKGRMPFRPENQKTLLENYSP